MYFQKMNRLMSKGMTNIYLKVIIEKNWRSQNFDFLSLKNCVSGSVFGEFQPKQISLNFRTSCCNWKFRNLGAKLCVVFLLLKFWRVLWHFQVKESMCLVEKKNFNKNETELKNGKSQTHVFIRSAN